MRILQLMSSTFAGIDFHALIISPLSSQVFEPACRTGYTHAEFKEPSMKNGLISALLKKAWSGVICILRLRAFFWTTATRTRAVG